MEAISPNVIGSRIVARTRAGAAVAVVAAAGLTALAAQWRIPLPFTPVPITGQTFAVLLAGAALGGRLGATSQLLYLAAGAVGLPVFTEASGGPDTFLGPTAGYLVGFVVAAAVVGRLAEARRDRRVLTATASFVAGTAVIYAFGVAGLVVNTGMPVAEAFAKGVVPFLVGDAVKAAVAGLALPAAWKLTGR